MLDIPKQQVIYLAVQPVDMRKSFDALYRYSTTGHLNIDNNWAEQSMRPIALGRKNYLFVGSEAAGHSAATLYSLVETCKANRMNPLSYLSYLLEELPKLGRHPAREQIIDLLWADNASPIGLVCSLTTWYAQVALTNDEYRENMNTENRSILDEPIYAKIISGLIIFSVLCFSLDTFPDLDADTKSFLRYSEIVIVLIFTAEYIARVIYSENRLKFIFSFYGIIDLLAFIPFYLTLYIDLRALRLMRILRLVRILKLGRYSAACKRFVTAISMVKEELVLFSIASIIVFYLAAVGIYHFEHAAQPEVFRSIFDCLWWSVATLTTVGYGDVYPITVGGKLFTFCVLMVGLGLIAVPTGMISSALTEVRERDE